MSIRLFFLTILASLSALFSVYAADDCSVLTAPTDVYQCVMNRLSDETTRMQKAYDFQLKSSSTAQEGLLRSSQNAWITYQDTHCSFRAGEAPSQVQTAEVRNARVICKLRLTTQRADELERTHP